MLAFLGGITGYLSLLMIVDESGKVAAISKLDKNANAIGGYRP